MMRFAMTSRTDPSLAFIVKITKRFFVGGTEENDRFRIEGVAVLDEFQDSSHGAP
jgi:hypothetical protein